MCTRACIWWARQDYPLAMKFHNNHTPWSTNLFVVSDEHVVIFSIIVSLTNGSILRDAIPQSDKFGILIPEPGQFK